MTFDEAKAVIIAKAEAEDLSLDHVSQSELADCARRMVFAENNPDLDMVPVYLRPYVA